MEVMFEASKFCSPDAMGAASAFVSREYGYTGYRLGLAANTGAVSIFEVNHYDGSRFNVVADNWGNVRTLPQDPAGSERIIRDMHKNAVQA